VQAIPPVATHFSMSWSVCRLSVSLVLVVFIAERGGRGWFIAGSCGSWYRRSNHGSANDFVTRGSLVRHNWRWCVTSVSRCWHGIPSVVVVCAAACVCVHVNLQRQLWALLKLVTLLMIEWINEWMNEWLNGWMDGWMNSVIFQC